MDKAEYSASGDHNVKDITVCLRTNEEIYKLFVFQPSLLKAKSKFFAHQLSLPSSSSCIEIQCSVVEHKHYIDLLNLLHHPVDSLLDSWKSVNSALGILQVAVSLQCEEIAQSCVSYLEAVPWEENEEEEILRVVPKLGNFAMSILARVKPLDTGSTKSVFLAAIRYATSISTPCPPFGDEIQVSAQEQVEYMLGEDEETALVTTDEEVREEVTKGLSIMLTSFQDELSSETSEDIILHILTRLEWLCNILPKMNLMKDFVSKWIEISPNVITLVEDKKFKTVMWRLKLKLLEISAKVLESVGYGSVILPSDSRVKLLKTWLPYIRQTKPILDSKMDEDLSQAIQGAIVSLLVALPSSDQADILADWMESERLGYPDLTEAFEIWCYRTKSSKKRLAEGSGRVSSGSLTSDLSN